MLLDLNADLGEGAGHDADLLALVTSANVACGAHAGDPATAFATLRLAGQSRVRLGAHPGHPDREAFGRRELTREPQAVYENLVYQIGALAGLAKALAVKLTYVKPHGGLYHQANRDEEYARPVLAAAELFGLAVVGLPGSTLAALATGRVAYVAEGFADRRYRPDGTLVPRDQPDALIHDPLEAVRQAKELARGRGVRSLCVHGDHPEAVAFARALRDELHAAGIAVKPFA